MSAPLTHRPGSAVIEQWVKPEHVDAYRDWSRKINTACARSPGFVDLEVFEPVPGVSESFVIVVRFQTAAESEAWHHSAECQALLEEAAPLLHQKVVFHAPSSVYGSWFSGSTEAGSVREPSQRWKDALVVLFVLYPTVMLLSLFVTGPLLQGWSMATAMYVGNMMSVALMTWLLMPVVTGKLSFWLNPVRDGSRRGEALGLAIVLGGQLLMVAAFYHFLAR